jgi:hypothetical protein
MSLIGKLLKRKNDFLEVRGLVPSGADIEKSPRRRFDLTDCPGASWSYLKRVGA